MSDSPVILMIEDERSMRRFLLALLVGHGFRVFEAASGEQGLTLAASHSPDVILLDIGLPGIDGLEVTRRIREWTETPIIVLSARGQEEDKVRALDLGADDYLTKPFGASELLARVRVALRHAARRASADAEPLIVIADLEIDLAARIVRSRGEEVHLTPIEYRLLALLARYAGCVLTHHQILEEVWGPGARGREHYVRVHMSQLRRKIEADPAQPQYILTEIGVGYRLRAEV